jgi:hypothetical protein
VVDREISLAHGRTGHELGEGGCGRSMGTVRDGDNSVLVGNVADMSPHVVATPTMSAENGQRHNVANAVTGFVAG